MTSDPLFWPGLLCLIGALYILLQTLLHARWRRMKQMPCGGSTDRTEDVSLVVLLAARDEEETIRETLRSLHAGANPSPRIIVVNDRSTDRTGEEIACEVVRTDTLVSVQVRSLPEGWLGKCHALHQGAKYIEREEWVLFTDADVVFTPGVLTEAVAEAERAGADHFVLMPRLEWHGKLEGSILNLFALLLSTGFRFRQVESNDPKAYIGIGAFNMIRRDLYQRIGGHRRLRMEVADDMKLGYLAKIHGGRSTARYGGDRVRVRWRHGALDTLRGIVRSAFPGVNFHWGRLLWGVFGLLTVFVLPFVLLPFAWGTPAGYILLAACGADLATAAVAARGEGVGLLSVLLTPLAGLLFAGALVISGFSITKDGGVWWRETFYPIDELRSGTVR